MQSSSEKKERIAVNHKGSIVDVTLLHIGAVFPPLVIVGHGEGERGGSVPFLNIQKNACSFVSSIKHRIMRGDAFLLCFLIFVEGWGREFFFKKRRRRIKNTWFPLGVSQCAKITWWNELVVVTLWSLASLASSFK